jgi:hypothetical protein
MINIINYLSKKEERALKLFHKNIIKLKCMRTFKKAKFSTIKIQAITRGYLCRLFNS